MKRAVVTGGTGYIGSNLIKTLLKEDWCISIIADPRFGYSNIEDILSEIEIIEYSGDITILLEWFSVNNPDVVFHLAAAVITDCKPSQIANLIQSYIQFGCEVMEAMLRSSCRNFICTGSYWQNYNSNLYNPVDLYAATKESFEIMCQYYIDRYQYNVISLRLFDVYGENDKRPKLLNKLCQIAGTQQTLDISPGEQMLDLIHISDVCSAYLKTYEYMCNRKFSRVGVFGVCTGKRYKLKDIISLFEKILGKKINVNLGGKSYKEREVMFPILYNSIPNWLPKIDISEGLARFRNKC